MDKLFLTTDAAEKFVLAHKKVLNFKEACQYTGISESCLYKKTAAGAVPHSKPSNKLIFFDREALESWLLSNPITLGEDIEQYAINYVTNNPMKGGEW